MTERIPAGQIDPATLKIHPAADLFPMLAGAEFDALVDDIRANGLQHPILLDSECRFILDGRNRLKACPAAGREPRFERHTGHESPIDLIVTLNVRRRHLNESQRALVAARLVPQLKPLEKAEDGCSNLTTKGRPARAAALLNVSRSSVVTALAVLKSGNQDLIHAVENGALKVSTAARKLRPPSPAAPAAHAELSIPKLSPGDSALLLWGPTAQIAAAVTSLEALGFRYRRLDP